MNKQNFFSISDPSQDFTRDSYKNQAKDLKYNQKPPQRPHVNDLLPHNHANDIRTKDRTIRELQDEIKNLNGKISMVIEKDQEIYRLQCENDTLQRDIAEYRALKTDDILKRENEDYCEQLSTLEKTIQELQSESILLKKKIIEMHHKIEKYHKDTNQSHINGPITDEMIGRYIRSLISYKNTQFLFKGIS